MRRLFVTLLASVTAAVGLLAGGPAAHAGWSVDNQHQLVPLYVYPDWWNTGNDWFRACEAINETGIGSTVIANLGADSAGNPGGGPGTAYNSDYAQVIDYCHDAGQNVIGYVDTNYGNRPLAAVKADIDAWYDRYVQTPSGVYDLGGNGVDSRIDGIFFDQMSNFPNDSTAETGYTVGGYYRELFKYVKAQDPNQLFDAVIGNPGVAAPTDWQLDDYSNPVTQVVDELVVFEGPMVAPASSTHGLNHFTPPAWVDDYPASDISMMVYDTPLSDVDDVCTTLKADNAGLVYVTDAQLTSNSTPWNSLPSDSYLSTLRSECG